MPTAAAAVPVVSTVPAGITLAGASRTTVTMPMISRTAAAVSACQRGSRAATAYTASHIAAKPTPVSAPPATRIAAAAAVAAAAGAGCVRRQASGTKQAAAGIIHQGEVAPRYMFRPIVAPASRAATARSASTTCRAAHRLSLSWACGGTVGVVTWPSTALLAGRACGRGARLRSHGHQPRLVGEDHRLHPVAGADLGQHPADVLLDGGLGQHEIPGDLRVRHPSA